MRSSLEFDLPSGAASLPMSVANLTTRCWKPNLHSRSSRDQEGDAEVVVFRLCAAEVLAGLYR
jgi:hypothetical protein